LRKRLLQHLNKARNKEECTESQIYFYRSLRKYGNENFTWEVLKECNNRLMLGPMETFMIMVHHSHYTEGGYNLTWGGSGTSGYKFTEEQKRKMRVPKTEEHKLKLVISAQTRRPITEKTRLKFKNRRNAPETRKKISESHKKYTIECIDEMRKLRFDKLTFKRISEILNIPETSIKSYCRDIMVDNRFKNSKGEKR